MIDRRNNVSYGFASGDSCPRRLPSNDSVGLGRALSIDTSNGYYATVEQITDRGTRTLTVRKNLNLRSPLEYILTASQWR